MVDAPNMVDLSPEPIPDDVALAIGRIVRLCADLEDCLNLWICKLAGTTEATSALVLGRSNLNAKVAIAQSLSKVSGERSEQLHKKTFGSPGMRRLLDCRNAVAHGAYAGLTDRGGYVFVTNSTVDYNDGGITRRADAYTIPTLGMIYAAAAMRIEDFDVILGLRALRKKRQWRRVLERPEHQPSRKQAAKQKPRPRPSGA